MANRRQVLFFSVSSIILFLLLPQPSSGKESPLSPWVIRNDAAWVDKLSPPQHEISFEMDLQVPMRDGVRLSANVWRPKGEGKFPVIFTYTPYDNAGKRYIEQAKYFAPRGYVFAAIDVRGRYDSEGESYLYWDPDWRNGKFDGLDVHDCLTWLGQQPWSSGKVGMTGGSYLGVIQWLGAPLGNPYLAALIPYVNTDDQYYSVFQDGAFRLSTWLGLLGNLSNHARNVGRDLRTDFWDWEKLYWLLPLRSMDEALLGQKDQVWQDNMDHPDNDFYWRFSVGERLRPGEAGPGKYAQVQVPTLNITGWWDVVQQGTINNYLGMVRHGPEKLRRKHHLIVGPWEHGVGPRKAGELDFGPEADVDFRPIELRWFDYWLKGIDNGIMEEPPVNIFVMGENRWRSEQEWPPSRARETRFYFHSSARANSRFGDGSLSTTQPSNEPPDSFIYDPEDPVPGNVYYPSSQGPRDQRSIQIRDDVLVYTGEKLQKDIEVTGRVLVKLFASSSAGDTDFTTKLVDVHPNGYAQHLLDGIIRARYRNSFQKPELITPGQIYEYTIDLWSVSHVFQKGHKIQIEISSSNFPHYDRNPNTGHKFGEDAEVEKATQKIYHDRRHASHILLPVVQ